MRLWSLHPRHLDGPGLVALWREGLLARAVLRGAARGYRRHPQLARFLARRDPVGAINAYLAAVLAEARRRGYRFDGRRIRGRRARARMRVTAGQLRFEWEHLQRKLRRRSARAYRTTLAEPRPDAHPLFVVTLGPVEAWERGPGSERRGSRASARR